MLYWSLEYLVNMQCSLFVFCAAVTQNNLERYRKYYCLSIFVQVYMLWRFLHWLPIILLWDFFHPPLTTFKQFCGDSLFACVRVSLSCSVDFSVAVSLSCTLSVVEHCPHINYCWISFLCKNSWPKNIIGHFSERSPQAKMSRHFPANEVFWRKESQPLVAKPMISSMSAGQSTGFRGEGALKPFVKSHNFSLGKNWASILNNLIDRFSYFISYRPVVQQLW